MDHFEDSSSPITSLAGDYSPPETPPVISPEGSTTEIERLDIAFASLVKFIKSVPGDEWEGWFREKVSVEDATWIYKSLDHRSNNFERRRTIIAYDSLEKHLGVTMPSPIHEAHCAWISIESRQWAAAGLLPVVFDAQIRMTGSPRYTNFVAPYVGSIKEADLTVKRKGLPFPTMVIEAGLSESRERLRKDKILWDRGSGHTVCVIMVIKYTKRRFRGVIRVFGDVEVTTCRTGVKSVERRTIFPVPTPLEPDLELQLGDLFGTNPPPGVNVSTRLPLRMSSLREVATDELAEMGLTPA